MHQFDLRELGGRREESATAMNDPFAGMRRARELNSEHFVSAAIQVRGIAVHEMVFETWRDGTGITTSGQYSFEESGA